MLLACRLFELNRVVGLVCRAFGFVRISVTRWITGFCEIGLLRLPRGVFVYSTEDEESYNST